MSEPISDDILVEMQTYYRQRAQEYDEWFYRHGRYDHGQEWNTRWFREGNVVQEELRALHLGGDILELAPGTGIWTEQFLRSATSITAVDASPEMIAINRARLGSDRVTYIQSDLFSWQPTRTYDAVCFCFWLSHIPTERLDAFLHMIAQALRPGGKIFFVDNLREPDSTANNQELPAEQEQLMIRKLNNGQTFRIVKNYYGAIPLKQHFLTAGLDITIKETATYFIYGYGNRI